MANRNPDKYPRTPKRRHSSKKRKTTNPSTQKGRILERIVAALYDAPGLKVQTNVMYPTTDGAREREVDVLVSANVAGLKVEYVFQCKNELGVIGTPTLDGFAAALDDIGVPRKYGILVSVNGFTKPAIAYSKKLGIQLLVLKGLTKDRLRSEISRAIQHNIFLIPRIKNFSVQNNIATQEFDLQFLTFVDEQQKSVGIIPDLIFNKWQNGEIEEQLGEHTIELEAPTNWFQFYKGEPMIHEKITAIVEILALAISIDGHVENHLLFNADSQELERLATKINFDPPRTGAVLPIQVFATDQQLQEFIQSYEDVSVVVIRRLPRLLVNDLYYPLSKEVAEVIFEKVEKHGPSFKYLNQEQLWKEVFEVAQNDVFRDGQFSLTGKEIGVICTDSNGRIVDVRCLFEQGEYEKIIGLKDKFLAKPSKAFADLLAWAFVERSRRLLQDTKQKKASQKIRLYDEIKANANNALSIIPNFLPAIDQLAAVFHLEKNYPAALEAIDYILARESQRTHLWIERSEIFEDLGNLGEALASLDKALEVADDRDAAYQEKRARLHRAHVLGRLNRYSDASLEIHKLFQIDIEFTVNKLAYLDLTDEIAQHVEDLDQLLLYIEVLYCRAAIAIQKNMPEYAESYAGKALAITNSLKAVEEPENADVHVGQTETVLLEDFVKRITRRLRKAGDVKFANKHSRVLRKWFDRISKA